MRSSCVSGFLFMVVALAAALSVQVVSSQCLASDQTVLGRASPSAGYPRLVAFRVSEGLKTADQYALFTAFDLIHSFHNLNYQLLDKYNSTAPVIAHWRLGIASRPSPNPFESVEEKHYLMKLGDGMWPGHWLFYNGTKLTRDLPADKAAITIHVEDTSVFQDPSEAPARLGPDDIQIYALSETGKAIWQQSEQVVLESIDHAAKTISVRRAQHSSSPLAFNAGRAVAAVHARTPFVSIPDPYVWRINFTRHCPVNPATGLTGAEFAGRLMGEELKQRTRIQGAEFDVGEWIPRSLTITRSRNFDADNDLKPDHCQFMYPGVGVVNEHGLGQSTCLKAMRDTVGDQKILQADSRLRAYRYLNGSEWERYPASKRLASSQFEHLRYVTERTRTSPKISYLMGKCFTDKYNDNPIRRWGDNWPRMGLASALMQDAYYGYNAWDKKIRGKKSRLGFGRFYWWDEYEGGSEKKKHYLGMPPGPARYLDGQIGVTSVLRNPTMRGAIQIRAEAGYEATSRYNAQEDVLTVEILKQPSIASDRGISVFIPRRNAAFPPNAPFTLKASVRALTPYGKIDPAYAEVPALVECTLNPRAKRYPYFYADSQWRSISLTMYAKRRARGLTLHLGGDPGIIELRGLELLPGDGFVMYRLFENGIALLNGTEGPVRFDLAKIDAARQYRAISGTVTPDVNNGQPITAPVVVPPLDGRILIRR